MTIWQGVTFAGHPAIRPPNSANGDFYNGAVPCKHYSVRFVSAQTRTQEVLLPCQTAARYMCCVMEIRHRQWSPPA